MGRAIIALVMATIAAALLAAWALTLTRRPPVTTRPPLDVATAATAEAGAPLVRSARVDDPTGDVRDDTGAAVEVHGAADVTAVAVVDDGTTIVVTWELRAAPPAHHDALLWSVDLWVGEARAYTVTVQQVGRQRVAAVLDWSTAQQEPLDPPAVAGTSVRVTVAATATPRLGPAFAWSALSQIDLAYEDTVPDAPAEATVTVPFPG